MTQTTRRIRAWNIQHGFVVTYGIWAIVLGLIVWIIS